MFGFFGLFCFVLFWGFFGVFLVVMLWDQTSFKDRGAGATVRVISCYFMSWVLPGSLLPWDRFSECKRTCVCVLGTSLPEETAGLGWGCSEPKDHIPVRGCSRGEGGEAPSQPRAGLGGAGGWQRAEEEEKAGIFLNERLAAHPTPPPGSRLPPATRRCLFEAQPVSIATALSRGSSE